MGLKFEFIRGPRACAPFYFSFCLFFINRDVAFSFGRLAWAQQQQIIFLFFFPPLTLFQLRVKASNCCRKKKMECLCIVLLFLPLSDAKQPHTRRHTNTQTHTQSACTWVIIGHCGVTERLILVILLLPQKLSALLHWTCISCALFFSFPLS